MPAQQDLPMTMEPVFELDEGAPWPMPAPILWPAPRRPGAIATAAAATGSLLAAAILGTLR